MPEPQQEGEGQAHRPECGVLLVSDQLQGAKAGAALGALGGMFALGGMPIAGTAESMRYGKLSRIGKAKLIGELALLLGAYGAAGAVVGAPIGAAVGKADEVFKRGTILERQ